jgi:hypothetical protein
MTSFQGWTSDAVALVQQAIAVHGGLAQWREVARINLPFRSGSGVLLRLKGFGRTFPAPREYEVRPHERVTIFHDYPDAHHRGRYERGNVTIEHLGGHAPLVTGIDHRQTFTGLAKYRLWSPLDALYFFGHALSHYHVLPFTLPAARLVDVLRDRGVPVGIDVIFAPDLDTHSRRQRVYFGADGRIVRHDYVADVIGPFARGAHYWEDYERCGGLLIARRRRVVARIGKMPTPLTALHVQLGEPRVQ